MSVYGYPVLPRAGLGNMLLPWADCYLWCRDRGLALIAPSWRKLRVGPLIRGERDRRDYHRLFSDRGQISGMAKWVCLLKARKVRFTEALEVATGAGDTVVVFDELEVFHRLAGRQEDVRDGLRAMTRPEYLPVPGSRPTIGVHVRLGDYLSPGAPKATGGHHRLELSWYLAALREIRRVAGLTVAAEVFSDGDDDELQELLREENVTRSPYRTAVSDLLALAESGVIIASCSTFSMWGAFLGQVPTVWHPGSRFRSVVEAREPFGLEPEWRPGLQLPDLFVASVRAMVSP